MSDEPLLLFGEIRRIRQQNVAEAQDRIERSSQLVTHRREEFVFQIVQFKQPQIGLSQLVNFSLESAIELLQIFLHRRQVSQHSIERLTQFFKLITRSNVGALFEITSSNRIADLFNYYSQDEATIQKFEESLMLVVP